MVDCVDDESAVDGLTATPVVVLFQLGAGFYTHFSPFPKQGKSHSSLLMHFSPFPRQGKSHSSLLKHFSWFPKW